MYDAQFVHSVKALDGTALRAMMVGAGLDQPCGEYMNRLGGLGCGLG